VKLALGFNEACIHQTQNIKAFQVTLTVTLGFEIKELSGEEVKAEQCGKI
jgi:hypothetical protein